MLEDPERDDNRDPGIADAMWERDHPGETRPDGSDDELRRFGPGPGSVVEESAGPVPEAHGISPALPMGARDLLQSDDGLTPPDTSFAAPGSYLQPPTSEGLKLGAAYSGLTDAGANRVSRFQAGLYGKGATANKTDQMMAGRRGELDANAQGYANATDEAKAATAQGSQIESDYNTKLAAIHDQERDFNQHYHDTEQQFYLQGQAEKQKYLGEYQQQLAGVRQLVAQNANPLGGLGTIQGAGLGMAQFAQGFLAARGIHIDVAGQVDKWVDRELQQHQLQIQNAEKGAEGTLSLYNLARQNSRDDSETREKLRGFAIEGFKLQIQAEGDRFNSDIGRANAAMKVAQLDKEQAATTERLGSTYFQEWHQTYSGLVDESYKMGQLAIERQKASLEQQRYNAQQDAAKEAAKREMIGNIIYDTSQKMMPKLGADGKPVLDAAGKQVMYDAGGGGAARFIYKPGTQPKQKEEYATLQAGTNTNEKLFEDLRQMYRSYGNRGITDVGRFSSTDQAKFLATRNEILSNYTHTISGAQASDPEVVRLAKSLPDNGAGTAANLEAIYSQTQNHFRQKLDDARHEIADELPDAKDIPARQQFMAKYGYDGAPLRQLKTDNSSHFNEAGYADAHATAASNAKVTEPHAFSALKIIEAPKSHTEVSDRELGELGMGRSEVDMVWKHYRDQYGGAESRKPPSYAAGIMRLARDAESDPQSKQALQNLITKGPDTADKKYDLDQYGEIIHFAQYAAAGMRFGDGPPMDAPRPVAQRKSKAFDRATNAVIQPLEDANSAFAPFSHGNDD